MGENPAALRAAVFSLSSKNLRGGGVQTPPPPSRARVKTPPSRSQSRALLASRYVPNVIHVADNDDLCPAGRPTAPVRKRALRIRQSLICFL